MKKKKIKRNVEKIKGVLEYKGLKVTFKEAQWASNTLFSFMAGLISKELHSKPESIYAIICWFCKITQKAWDRLNISDREYDLLKRSGDWVTDKRVDQEDIQTIGQILEKIQKDIAKRKP